MVVPTRRREFAGSLVQPKRPRKRLAFYTRVLKKPQEDGFAET